jgi:hypothetical protein
MMNRMNVKYCAAVEPDFPFATMACLIRRPCSYGGDPRLNPGTIYQIVNRWIVFVNMRNNDELVR